MPVIGYQRADEVTSAGLKPLGRTGVGTPMLSVRFAALTEQGGAPVDLAIELGAGLPVGSQGVLAREDGPVLSPRLSIGRDLGTVRIGADLGAGLKRPTSLAGVSGGSTTTAASELTGGVFLASQDAGPLRGEVNLLGGAQLAGGGYSLEALAGARYRVDPGFELFALGGPGFGTSPGTPVFRVLLGATLGGGGEARHSAKCVEGAPHNPFDCPDLDKDGDGVPNRADNCPSAAEDKDGFNDADGCPDLDNDNDGLVDARDACPTAAGTEAHKGCPVIDQDGDLIADDVDRCPLEKGAAQTQGCPDQDGDGIATADDRCPAQKGPAETKGCPDQDGDRFADLDDKCPTEGGPGSADGCPMKDQDQDGLADAVDNCPKEKGPAENAGCPGKQKQLVQISKERLVIADKVYFATAKAKLLPRSNLLLNQIAQVLKNHPEIGKVTVEGHTDNVGTPETNLKLSKARAEAVKAYLIGKGVQGSRVEAKGFGGDQPVESNTSKEGREANRRVEFKLGYGDEEAGPVPLN